MSLVDPRRSFAPMTTERQVCNTNSPTDGHTAVLNWDALMIRQVIHLVQHGYIHSVGVTTYFTVE